MVKDLLAFAAIVTFTFAVDVWAIIAAAILH